jgi:hypothetical protein
MKNMLTTTQTRTLPTKKIVTTFAISAFILVAATVNTSSEAEIYKWTDAKGVIHYSSQKPMQKKIKSKNIEDEIRFAAGKSRESSGQASQSTNQTVAKNTEKTATKLDGPSAKLVSYCKGQRTNLAQLKKNFRNVWQGKDGKKTRLDQKQRQEKVNQLQQSITAECAGV